MNRPIVLGIDGGGTKTVAVVMDSDRQVLGRAQAGSTNWNSVGVETARTNLHAVAGMALAEASRAASDLAAICIGASGVDRADDRTRMQAWLHELAPQAATAIHNDAVVALSAGTGGDVYGLVLISGTGMIVYGFDRAGRSRRAGGTGALLGDPGSGYAIGADSLAAVMWAADGRGPETSLTGAILGQLGMAYPTDLIPWTYADTAWERFASVAPQAIHCAEAGDSVALAILEKAAHGLAVAVQAVAAGLAMGDDFPLVMAGGLLRPGFYAGMVEQAVAAFAPQVKVIHPQMEPAVGAGLLVLKGIGDWGLGIGYPLPNPQSPIPAPRSPIPSPQSPIPAPRSPIPSPQSPAPSLQSPPPTETRNPASAEMDNLSALDFARLMNRLDAAVPLAVAEVLPQIARAIETIAAQLAGGGRLFYLGAGTSGRLGVLDATELVPTFSLPAQRAIGLMAGGERAITHSVEDAEDSAEQGRGDLLAHDFGPGDVLVGIAASGGTPYVIGGLVYARQVGAPTIALVCNPGSRVAAAADIAIEVVTGPEILTGSTRLKAGTAQKLVLNMLSTGAMVQLGKVYGNWMVDVQPTNVKLRERAVRIVDEITGAGRAESENLLTAAGWRVKTAVVMGLAGVDATEAETRLDKAQGRVGLALAEVTYGK